MENLETTTTERLVKLLKWEQMYGFVKDNGIISISYCKENPKFLEYHEIVNDENEMFEWFKQWCGDDFDGNYEVYLKQLTK
jgi:hypothetical protein